MQILGKDPIRYVISKAKKPTIYNQASPDTRIMKRESLNSQIVPRFDNFPDTLLFAIFQ